MQLWLQRHARVRLAPGVCYGRLDVPADPGATAEAAAAMAAVLPLATPVWCSPLQRCERLAQALHGLRPDLTYKIEPRLAEMHFGDWEGRPWADLSTDALRAWTDDFSHHLAGGGESVSHVMRRVAASWCDARMAVPPGTPMLWITHAGVARAMTLLAAGISEVCKAAQWPVAAPAFGEWTVLDIDVPFAR